jgi:AraC family transcriptional regulator of adaptative response/methylated-DNA-[protein]-cysteine methyltransferase
MVQRVCRMIEAEPVASLTLDRLSREIGISSFHLQRVFKRITGVTPRQYAEQCRSALFRSEVRNGGSTVAAATYQAGYGSSSRLYERSSAELGMTPATYRRGGKGMKIGYTIATCPLGRLLVASTEKGVCAVSLADSERELESMLEAEYPDAEIHRDDDSLGSTTRMLLSHLAGEQPHLDLPIDVQATAFQRRVWAELQRIPYGATRSYSEVAEALGKPRAVRAVARACASNRVALVIPCHRVIREDKSLGGYRWGIKRKKALLTKEAGGWKMGDRG